MLSLQLLWAREKEPSGHLVSLWQAKIHTLGISLQVGRICDMLGSKKKRQIFTENTMLEIHKTIGEY